MGTQARQQGKKENNGTESLNEEPECHRDPDIILVKTNSGNKEHCKEKGRWKMERHARHDECRQYSYTGASRRGEGM